ncbi:hypothetical protein GCM10007933_02740 [Zoogloea oryzae]|uniref:Uncharacterized protein n=2 Tax=Zoogloea oryzae TaxID=310767 RepID=A0ABQ6F6E3_9RHOO|nr:hypothetical protein GCM10007933_02740 [Zoogloea oryzae]
MSGTEFWSAESLRFTFFYCEDAPDELKPSWATLVGEQPANRTERRSQQVVEEDGVWEDMSLVVASSPGRIDVMARELNSSSGFPVIGEFESTLARFRSLLAQIDFSKVNRIAVGGVLLHPEPDNASAYDTLGKFLPNIKFDAESREFFYQINRPFGVEVEGFDDFKFNSIRRWSAVQLQLLSLEGSSVYTKVSVASRLELDVNSPADVELSRTVGAASRALEIVVDNLIEVARGGCNA